MHPDYIDPIAAAILIVILIIIAIVAKTKPKKPTNTSKSPFRYYSGFNRNHKSKQVL